MNKILATWKTQSLGTRILRFWLGATWLYGGWQKATDPTFLDKASANYIGQQLSGYATSSPVGFVLKHFIEHATQIGVLTMLIEFAIGIAVLSGAFLDLAILGGAAVSFGLWLSVSWHAYPYFYGSDSAYFVMWIGLFFLVRKERTRKVSFIPNLTDRREFVKLLGVGATAVIAAIAGSGLQKKLPKAAVGKEIVKLADFPVGSVKQFTAPDGNPAFLFRTKAGVFAYSAVCTHQGCVVAYSGADHTLNCACHGGKFDPANGGKVLGGPPPSPLPSYKVAIQGASIVTA